MMHEEQYWQAVLTRDARSDGAFVYAVRSTGIYCNPSCPSRKPHREQVTFFAIPEAAEKAGFRPCRRCSPRETATGEPHILLVQRACAYIEKHCEESLSLATLSETMNMSPYHLQRIFKRITGITPHQYIETYRLKRLKEHLKAGEAVTTAMYDAGYGSSSRLYERARLGMSPTTYRKGGQGMNIRYSITDSALGRLLIAATEKGICSVCLGDVDAILEAALLSEYPAATIERDDNEMADWITMLLHHLDGQQPDLHLPLDVQATAFQWRVWTELQAIPYGETRSYSEIAQALGEPKGVRAVANACATNPVALIVPCHRVVRSNGDIGGYRWGVERKQRLLTQEQTSQVKPG
ncbi:MAG TPA: bifunctional DNA-binding transcriptional regulator/O6-methylguanine-DNA methyltransferase Ada [Ktedonobacteraceae bacterium]|nr:bifunctional DNA-binding transcriptional regulator/O6-methylguanine-DNA methyltransferase Ada [Ktedonobacteraceae bacterium]